MRRTRSGAGFPVGLAITFAAVTLSVLAIAGSLVAFAGAGPAAATTTTAAATAAGSGPSAGSAPVAATEVARPLPRPVSHPGTASSASVRACRVGFDLDDDGRCVSEPATTCPVGRLSGIWCLSEPAYTCPDAATLRGTACVTPAERICPAGATLADGSCSAKGRLTCLDGGRPDPSGRRCTSSPQTGSAVPPDAATPPSSPPSSPPSDPPPRPSACPKGSQLSADGWCDWPTSYECPDGLDVDDGSSTCTGPAQLTCPPNAALGADGCETAPTATCPAGTSYSEGDCRSAPTLTCEHGELEAKRCVSRPRCAPGTSLTRDGECVRQPADPTLPCPHGTVRTGDMCSPPAPTCPDGTITTSSGECVLPVTCPPDTVENPDGTCRPVVRGCPPNGWVLTDSGVCAPVEPICPAGTVRDDRGLCLLPEPPGCPPHTLQAPGGWCYPAPPEPVDPPQQPSRLPRDGELLLTPALADAGDSVTASGAGCDPSVRVTITSKDEVVGRATADEHGLFTTQLRFGTFAAGSREVTAECGPELTAQLDMVLASSTGAVARTNVLLLFLLLLGSLAIRRQIATG